MSLISKDNLKIVLQTLKKLLSFKADKVDLDLKLDKSEVTEFKAVEIVKNTKLVEPAGAEDNAVYTDENGDVYTL